MIPHEAMRIALEPVANRALADDFAATTTEELVNEAFHDFLERREEIPRESNWGGQIMVHLAALTASFYRAILDRVEDEARARSLTAKVTWAAYRKMARLPGLIARLQSFDHLKRLKHATDFFRRVPFGPPAYIMEDIDAGSGVIGFDVKRCPVADYMKAQGLAELCVETWCNLDFPLARDWGGWLERDQTIAGGGDRCTFRWHAGDPPAASVASARQSNTENE